MIRDDIMVSAEEITDPLGQDAARALAIVEEITGLATPAAACGGVIVSAAGGAQSAAVGRAADHDAPIAT
ncbi:hypothetical protein [Streptomyces clavifer]|uniref:hypothetical protein n=1 Tax=Streptomyces clavifer TaxID=68188 RepID=UPI003652FB1F